MKANKLNAKFGRENRFEVKPAVAPFRVTENTELDGLKNRLLLNLLKVNVDPELNAPLRRAANEAAALAWTTQFPLLFFPTLLEEKAKQEFHRVTKQREVFRKTKNLFGNRWRGQTQTRPARPAALKAAQTCDLAVCE